MTIHDLLVCVAVSTWGAAGDTALLPDRLPLDSSPDSEFRLSMISDSQGGIAVGDPFDKGSRLFNLYGGAATTDETGDVYTINFGAGYFFLDNVSINLDANVAYGARKDAEDALGGGLDLLFRWHFLRLDRFSTYVDGGAGIVAFEHEFPEGGTNFNFTLQAGFGATFQLNEDLILMGGLKWYHISNARTEGIENNIGFDSAMIYGGIMLPF